MSMELLQLFENCLVSTGESMTFVRGFDEKRK